MTTATNARAPGRGVGTLGLKAIEWIAVRKTLTRFGAEIATNTRKHDSVIMRLPTGITVDTGGLTRGAKRAHKSRVSELLASLDAAGLDPRLFVAVLDRDGGTIWQKRPSEIDDWQAVVFDRASGLLSSPKTWARIQVALDPPEERLEPLSEPRPAPAAPLEVHAWLVLSDVAHMAGLAGDAARRARQTLRYRLEKGTVEVVELLTEGKAQMIPRPAGHMGRHAKVWAIREDAALGVAEWMLATYGPPPVHVDAGLTATMRVEAEVVHVEPDRVELLTRRVAALEARIEELVAVLHAVR